MGNFFKNTIFGAPPGGVTSSRGFNVECLETITNNWYRFLIID
jgi:hypothetical protein